MYVVRTFEIALDRAESVGDAMRRARSGLTAAGCELAPLRLLLSDTFSGASKGCARAVKALPELADLLVVVEGGQMLSSFDEGVPGSRAHLESALAPERAQKLADGVPRSFPLNESHFFFAPVPALLGGADDVPPRASGRHTHDVMPGEVALYSQWWITGRRTRLFAAARDDLPPRDARELPPVADEVGALLAAMGAIRRERRRLEPSSPDERSQVDGQVAAAEARLAGLRSEWTGDARELEFPHPLAPDPASGGFLPVRDALRDVLGPAGYRQRSAPRPRPGGVWVLVKRTRRGNELELRLSRGPINGRLSARLILCGPMWRHDLGALPLAPGELEPCVGSQPTLRRALANLAFAAAAAERLLVPPLEEIHGEGFEWLTAVTAAS
ncbi:MAG TPA: hypothetical protein VKB80_34935 [Kofleriaceae bacterium]|nr:hypothetical protein [Kofleriaceae bacterium]